MRSDEELRAAAKNVAYEYRWFCESARRLKSFSGNERKLWEAPLVEVHVLHYRNLLDFFFPRERSHPDDVRVSLFTEDWHPEKPTWLEEERGRCNKLLSHITFSREEYKAKREMDWDVDETQERIKGIWASFVDAMPTERRAWFD